MYMYFIILQNIIWIKTQLGKLFYRDMQDSDNMCLNGDVNYEEDDDDENI